MPSQSLHDDPLNPSHPHHVHQHPHQHAHHPQQHQPHQSHQPQVHARHPLNPSPNPNSSRTHPHSHSHSQSHLPTQGHAHTPPSSTGGSLTGLPSREPAHLPLHRKLLFPYDPPDRPLPPIILGHGPDIEQINERIYHLLALALRAYVLSWYPRLSPRDRTLLPTLTADVFVPILSPILTRIRSEPERLCSLILLDVPVILGLHLETYWSARAAEAWDMPRPQRPGHPDTGMGTEKAIEASSTSLSATAWPETNDLSLRIALAYNRRLPLLSITPAPTPIPLAADTPYRTQPATGQPALSPQYLTALSDALLRVHLPTEDYAPAVERLIAREVVGRVVLAGLGRRLGEGWFWWQIGLKVLGEPGTRRGSGQATSPLTESARPPQNGSTTSTDETVSSPTPKVGPEPSVRTLPEVLFLLVARAWTILAAIWTLSTTLFAAYSAAPPISPEYRNLADPWLALGRELFGVDGRTGTERRMWRKRLVWGAVEMMVGLFGRFVDRLLPHLIMTHLLNPQTALRLTYLIERLMFPLDGYPAPSPVEPMPDEARDLRMRMNTRVGEILPTPFRAVFCRQARDVCRILDPLDNPGCNAHLVAMLLDAIVGTLEPELVASVSVGVGVSGRDEPPRDKGDMKVEQKE